MRKKLLIGLAISVLISLILVVTRNTSASLYFQGIVQQLFHSPKASLYHFSVSSDPEKESDRLREENAQLRAKLSEMQNLKRDNDALRSQFEGESVELNSLLPAQVLGFQGSITNPEALIIDRGANDNVRKGQAVVIGKNIVGIIDTVSERYSSIVVVTSASFSTVAKTSENSVLGVIRGAGDFLLFNQVAITDTLEEGDTVLTRGTISTSGTGVPPDLIIGKVETVRKVESEPFQSAKVESLLDISRLTRVFVVR